MIDKYFVKLNGYLVKDSKSIHTYTNVTNMKSDTTLKVGDHVKTKGYNNIQDGGHGEYIIINNNSLVEDNGSIHNLVNGLKAILIINNDSVNVKQFGAVGDGVTDDTIAIQNALNFRGNSYSKVIFNENETYLAQGYLDVYSNTDIELNRSTIKDCYTGDSITHHNGLCFRSATENANITGYGATKNINVKGGTLDGGVSGLMFAFLHGENIHFEDIHFYNCFVGTHIIDLCGCKNININNCHFEGNLITDASSSSREMIQPDYANETSGSYWGDITGYDDLPTVDLIIDNCIFEKGSGTYYPNAIGTHTRLALPHKNIIIKNCKFYDCTYSSIRLPLVDNLLIDNNIFYDLSTPRSDLNIFCINMQYIGSSLYSNASENITISNNKFLFDNGLAGNLNCIRIVGPGTTSLVKNIKIVGNIAKSTYNTNGGSGADFLQCDNCDNIIIDSNVCDRVKHFFYKNRSGEIINSMIVKNNKLEYTRDYISSVNTTYSEDTYCNIEEQDNIWTDDRGTVNLNNFKFVFAIPEDVPHDESNNTKTIVYPSPTQFITVDANGTIRVPNIFRNIKVYGFTAVSSTSVTSDNEVFVRLINRAPNTDKRSYSFATTSTSKVINYPTVYIDGKSEKIYSNGFSIQHTKLLPASQTLKANDSTRINTQLVIESL